jgi:peptidoglycan/xylan/chitin deacetylase (PgdA/CDA1 family)
MASKRQLATLLDAVGVSRAVLAARARALFPWRWLTVLTYHRVGEQVAPGFDPEVLDASPAVFERHVRLLQRYFNLIDTRDLDAWRAGGQLPPNPAMITFDDGYRDNHDTVMPILKRAGAKAVFFVATSYITDRRVFWWELVNHALQSAKTEQLSLQYPRELKLPLHTPADRRSSIKLLLKLLKREEGVDMERFLAELYQAAGLPFSAAREREMADQMLMTWPQIRALADAGFDVQSHSHAHRVLHTLTPEEARQDLLRARQELEGALDRPVTAVAYPTGRPLGDAAAHRQAVLDAGYRYGFTVQKLVPLGRMNDWLGIPRMMIDQDVTESFYRSTLAVPMLAY